MHYLDEDLIRLITLDQGTCYLSLSEKSLGSYIKNLAELSQYGHLLAQAPHVQYEFLQAFYSLNKQVSTLTVEVISDLTQMGWKTAASAAFISLFTPKLEYLPYFICCRELYPQTEHITNIAIATHSQTLSKEHYQHEIIQIQNALKIMQPNPMPLRLNPTTEQIDIMKSENDAFRVNYKRDGSSAVLSAIPSLLSSYYLQPYNQWVRDGAKPVECSKIF